MWEGEGGAGLNHWSVGRARCPPNPLLPSLPPSRLLLPLPARPCSSAPSSPPQNIKAQLITLCFAAFVGTWHLERLLRALFPAPIPPAKGYQVYAADVKRLQRAGVIRKKLE